MADNIKLISQNKKARHDYFIIEEIEAGIELYGTEVKSVRAGKVNLTDAYASIDKQEVFIKGMNISPYEQGNIFNRDPLRERKLLLHKKRNKKAYRAGAATGLFPDSSESIFKWFACQSYTCTCQG